MPYQIAYGRDTESLEDPTQLALLTLPDECSDMDSDELTEFINENWEDPEFMTVQDLVPGADVMESFALAMDGEGINPDMVSRILSTVADALGNNYYG